MKTFIATLIATAAGASIAIAPAVAQAKDAYQRATDKASADYRVAKDRCDKKGGDAEEVCVAEAKLMRAKAEAAAVTKYRKDASELHAARDKVIQAEYELAEEKCETMTGDAEDKCTADAKAVRTAALAELKGTRDGATVVGASGSGGLVTSSDTRDPVKSAAVDRCEKMTGDARTACLVENRDAATAAARTENAAERAGDKTRNVAQRAATAVADSTITTKVKAGLVADPDLSAMAINVDTDKGVVMLSGFVGSKAEAEKAERLAKDVEGVTKVKNALKVK
ncbi:BON domain-containing protein [Massilia niastensis]|uniref:BON domain-containing protein n=1 Tax=Massilia niastensis TaxID=544911 RepID=UPI00035DB178|nr:BON domain-containing protein [Massilia niastensis]